MKLSELTCIEKNIKLVNDGEFEILGLISVFTNRKTLSFIENEKYIKDLSKNVTCIFVKDELFEYFKNDLGIIICANPKIEFFKLHNYLCNNDKYIRSQYKTRIGNNCNISNKSIISSVNVIIGDNVTIEENVVIRGNVNIGENSIIRAGSIIGGDGFDFKRIGKECIMMVKHVGGVIIGKNVEIQQNCCVDKAVFPWDDTIIGDYTKMDNFVHIAHADKIGKRCLFAASSTVAGSTIIGDDCWIGVGAIISNNVIIGNECSVNIGAVVTKNIESGNKVSGNFAIDHSKFIKFIKQIR